MQEFLSMEYTEFTEEGKNIEIKGADNSRPGNRKGCRYGGHQIPDNLLGRGLSRPANLINRGWPDGGGDAVRSPRNASGRN
jgi:hypothetical protein